MCTPHNEYTHCIHGFKYPLDPELWCLNALRELHHGAHHLIDSLYNGLHFISSDHPVVIVIVQLKRPCVCVVGSVCVGGVCVGGVCVCMVCEGGVMVCVCIK